MTDTQAVRKAGTVLLVCFATVWCGAQSVADLAARGREKAVKGKPAKVYTNQDLKNAKGHVSQSRLSRADAAETGIPSAGPVVPVGSSTADPDEAFYHRLMDQFQAIEDARQNLSQAETDLIRAESAYQLAQPFDVFMPGMPGNIWTIERESPETIAVRRERLEAARLVHAAARREFEDAQQGREALLREARQTGIAAGVIRRAESDWAKRPGSRQ